MNIFRRIWEFFAKNDEMTWVEYYEHMADYRKRQE